MHFICTGSGASGLFPGLFAFAPTEGTWQNALGHNDRVLVQNTQARNQMPVLATPDARSKRLSPVTRMQFKASRVLDQDSTK